MVTVILLGNMVPAELSGEDEVALNEGGCSFLRINVLIHEDSPRRWQSGKGRMDSEAGTKPMLPPAKTWGYQKLEEKRMGLPGSFQASRSLHSRLLVLRPTGD